MRWTTDQELSSAAAHHILRSIAQRAWTKLDDTAGELRGHPVFADVRAQEDIEDDDERTLYPVFPWRMHDNCSISRWPIGEMGLP